MRAPLAAWLVLGLLLTGCTGAAPSRSPVAPASSAEPTTLASYDAQGARAVRGRFCDRVSPTGIEHALGEAAEHRDSWENGDRVRLPDGTRDRIHEYGCSWTAPDGTRARAWVFAPPVSRARARSLAEETRGKRCRPVSGQPFGKPSAAVSCRVGGGERMVRFAGLFGDGWLTCELTDRAVDVAAASAWCVTVLEAARA